MEFEPREEQKQLKYSELRIYSDDELNNYTEEELKNFKVKHNIPDVERARERSLAELCGRCEAGGPCAGRNCPPTGC